MKNVNCVEDFRWFSFRNCAFFTCYSSFYIISSVYFLQQWKLVARGLVIPALVTRITEPFSFHEPAITRDWGFAPSCFGSHDRRILSRVNEIRPDPICSYLHPVMADIMWWCKASIHYVLHSQFLSRMKQLEFVVFWFHIMERMYKSL